MHSQNRTFKQNLKGHSPQVAKLAESLRQLVLAAVPDIQEYVKNGYSQYGKNGIVLGITIHKSHVNLQFYYGTSLSDPDGLLEGTGKQMRHVTIRTPEDLRTEYLSHLVREAVQKAPRHNLFRP